MVQYRAYDTLATLAIGFAVLLAACGDRAARSTSIDRRIDFVRTVVVPATMRPGHEFRTEDKWSTTVRWEFNVNKSWIGYVSELRAKLGADYAERTTTADTAAWTRMETGDHFSITVRQTSIGPPMRVVVTFTGIGT